MKNFNCGEIRRKRDGSQEIGQLTLRNIGVSSLFLVAGILASLVCVESSRAADHSQNPSVGNVNTARVMAQASIGTEWLVNGRDFGSTHFSPLTDINDSNVNTLGLAWSVDVDSPMGMPVEPLVADGLIFVPGTLDRVFAFEANTGKLRWRFDPQLKLDATVYGSYAARVNRGVALWEGKVFIGTGDCRVMALDAASGRLLWQTVICDAVQTGITGAPRVGGGKVFIGYHGAELGIRGSLVALDASSGRIAWRFWNVPGDPAKGFENKALAMAAKTWSGDHWWEDGSGDVWDPIVYDPQTGLVIYGTAGPGMALKTGGDRLFWNCIIAVKADTGEYVWHYQTSQLAPKSVYGWPENFHIVVTDLAVGGAKRHVAMTVPRWGGFIVIDARSGKLISWKSLAERDATQRSPATESGQARSLTGHNWPPMSYSPFTGLTYVPAFDYAPVNGWEEFANAALGRLVAWDPVKQSARWSVGQPLAFNGGVLSTAGNLVFQGQGTGDFCAYAADSGHSLWCFKSGGSAIQSVPVSYRSDGRQYVLAAVGLGGGLAMFAGTRAMATAESKTGPSRLLAFALGAKATLPPPHAVPAVPKPPEQTASSAVIERGEQMLHKYRCQDCHGGKLLEGRGAWVLDGAVPDLRYMPKEVHDQFLAIVLGGARRQYGMPGFGDGHLNWPITDQMTVDEANALHAYIIELQWKAYAEDHKRLGGPK